jgi:methylated-DNA-[protein]-cysteine S-methyltransferase
MTLLLDRVASPIGDVLLVCEARGLCALEFADEAARLERSVRQRYGGAKPIATADPLGVSGRIRAYFAGRLEALDDIPVAAGGTPFQRAVWAMLRAIPLGTVTTYGTLALRLGKPNASRAVGLANALNPIAIVVPCHRVIGADASLTGYAGGLRRKRWLLEHEGVALPQAAKRRVA